MPNKSLAELHAEHKKKIAEQLAVKHLDIETLERRYLDRLDFHDVSAWGVKAALIAAFDAGMAFNEATRDDLSDPKQYNK